MEQEENAFFKLIHVGKPQRNYKTGSYHINCHFQPWSTEQNCPINNDILIHCINSTFAGELACGTLWTNKNIKNKAKYTRPTEHQNFHTGPNKLYAKLLKFAINTESLTPKDFWRKQEDTWIISIEYDDKIIIIPYFELIRVLFYQTSHRITNFLLSQTPLDQLCRPLTSPSIDNSFIARYYVAATNLTAPEARLLGSILFDPSINYIFNVTQTYWRIASSENNLINFNKVDSLVIGDFKNLSFRANGYNFVCDRKNYFWAESLDITEQAFCFKKLLFYPLHSNDKQEGLKHANISYLPICSDVFKSLINHKKPPAIYPCTPKPETTKNNKVSVFKSRRQERRAVIKAGRLPFVVRRSAWAVLAPNASHYLTDELIKPLESQAPLIPKNAIQYTDGFKKIISEFTSRHYASSYLTLNNQDQSFGKDLSVLPVDKYSPLPSFIYNGQVRLFPLVKINLRETFFYMAQPFPHLNPELIILIIKQNLLQPTDSELNEMLSYIIPIRNPNDFLHFHKRMKYLAKYQTASNTALLAIPVPTKLITVDFCLTVVDNVIGRFRKRIQLFIATFLRFPQGVNKTQMAHIANLSRYMCKTPDPLLLASIERLWYSS